MTCLKVVCLDQDTFAAQTRVRTPSFEHTWVSYPRSTRAETLERIADADIVVTNKAKLDAETLACAKKLKLVAVAATGTDVVDLQAASELGIVVSNIRNYAKNTVPEHTFALILTLRRSIKAYHDAVRAGRWIEADQFCFFDYPIRDLAGSTLGIIGDGILGQEVARIASVFGMRVLFATHKGRTGMGALYTPFEDVLAQSDILSLHCPLRASTRNMISTAEFALMQRKPLLINTARGGLVDENALVDALRTGAISGAGFDVVSTEPMPKDHPFTQIMNAPNFVLTPHVAWASDEAMQSLADQLIDNIEAFVRGEPRNSVQPLSK